MKRIKSAIKEITEKIHTHLILLNDNIEESNNNKIKFLMILFALIITAAKIWLTSAQTLTVLTEAIHDDRLFINLADNIINGRWLGEYDRLTLIKGMFFPLWIAVMSKLHIPLLLSNQLLYIISCIIFVIAVRHKVHNFLFLIVIYLILLFNPMSYSYPFVSVIREDIIQSQTILIFALLIGLFIRFTIDKKNMILWSAGLGITMASFWLTREDAIWILPTILLIIITISIKMLFDHQTKALKKTVILYVPFIILFFSLGIVAAINKIQYGIFITNEFKAPGFKSAYGALTRVKHENWNPQIPVPKEARMKIYPFSPAFTELKPYLEGNLGDAWVYFSKLIFGLKWTSNKKAKGEMMGGVFMWALRDAVNEAGYYKTAQTAENYYKRLAKEINQACDEKKIPSIGKRATFMPPFNIGYVPLFFQRFPEMIIFSIKFDRYSSRSLPSEGNIVDLGIIGKFTHEKTQPLASTNTGIIKIQGWIFHENKKINLSIRDQKGNLKDIKIVTTDSKDVYEHFLGKNKNYLNAQNAHFYIEAHGIDKYYLSISDDYGEINKIPLNGSIKSLIENGLYFYLDYINIPSTYSKLDNFKLELLDRTAKIYMIIVPYLFGLVFFIFIFKLILIFDQHDISKKRIIQLSVFGAILSRMILLLLFDITSFIGIQPRYLAPLYPLILIFIIFELFVKEENNYISWK